MRYACRAGAADVRGDYLVEQVPPVLTLGSRHSSSFNGGGTVAESVNINYLEIKTSRRDGRLTKGRVQRAQLLAATSYGGLFAALFGYEFLSTDVWAPLLVLFAGTGVVGGWVVSGRSTRLLAAPMLAGSVVGVAWTGWDPVAEGVLAGAGVTAFILAAQVLGDAIERGGFDRLIRTIWMNLRWRTASLALLGGYLLSWAFMFTSMPVMYSALYRYDDAAREARSLVAKDLGILLARAYASAAVATPMGATVLVALAVTSVSLARFLLVAAPLSLMMAPLALIGMQKRLSALDEPGARMAVVPLPEGSRRAYVLLWGMVAALTVMIGLVSVFRVPPLAGVSAGVILIAVIWGLLGTRIVPEAPGGFSGWSHEFGRYGRRLSDGALLIISGSIAGTSLARTPLMEQLASLLSSLDITVVGVAVTVVVVITLRVVGMPPPAIVLVAGPVLVRAVPLDPEAMAVLLVAASTFGFLVSPASLTSAMVSSLTGWSPVEVSLTRQAPFVMLSGVLSCVYVLLIP
jgi:hypothetical protein